MTVVWRKALASNDAGGNCVLYCRIGSQYVIRDSKDLAAPAVYATADEWAGLTAAVAAGDPHPWVQHLPTGYVHLIHLKFKPGEWDAFVTGCRTDKWIAVPTPV